MVKQGKYSVELINADGRVAFPEHKSESGEIFVEVEPDSEYYIRIQTDSEDRVKVHFSVDGSDLGYNATISKKDPPQDKGLWEYKDGKSYQHALKFAKAQVRQATNETSAPFWTGKVEVTFYEARFSGYKEQRDFSNKWNGGDVSYVMGISTHFYYDDEPLVLDEDYRRKEAYYGMREALASLTPGGIVGDGVLLNSDVDKDGNPWGYQWMQPEPEDIAALDSVGDVRPDWEQSET